MQPSPPIPEGPERRAALTAEITAGTGLNPSAIEHFLRAFYGAARTDPLLAPAFAGVTDWEAHIATITRFWSSVALMTGGYHGQPMQAHAHLRLTPSHFARWVALFEEIARAHFSAAGAAHMIDRARRIARSLEMGLIPLTLPTAHASAPQGALS
ncbi:group III truncated hemoglobin [Roseomonas sp. CAU 1739]|uniref:group III truncated hemoglobin n=1 Tax=Roseomonas sp. CAU 1739 TaxID=3140364 RepID=UPI00325AF8AB